MPSARRITAKSSLHRGGEGGQQSLERLLQEELGVSPTEYREIAILGEPDEAAHGAYEYDVFLVTEWNGRPANLQPEEHTAIE